MINCWVSFHRQKDKFIVKQKGLHPIFFNVFDLIKDVIKKGSKAKQKLDDNVTSRVINKKKFTWAFSLMRLAATQIYWNKRKGYLRKELNSNRIGLVNQHGCCFIVLKHQYGSHDDIMGVRSILPLLLKKKNTMLKWSVIISGTHSFLTFFYYVAPHILSCMEFWNLNSSHYSRKVHVGGGKGGNRLAHIFSHFFPLKKSCTRAETNIFLDFQDNITSM